MLPLNKDKYWQPVEDTVLLIINDLVRERISVKEAGEAGRSLAKLGYFTGNLYSVDPELWFVLDLLSALGDLSIVKTSNSDEDKLQHINSKLEAYLDKNKKRLDYLLQVFGVKL